MTKSHLLGVAKVRRSLMIPIVVFTVLNAAVNISGVDAHWAGIVIAYALFDIPVWIGVAFLIFAVIEWRQNMPPQPRIAAMAAATAGITTLALAIIALRALFGVILRGRPFLSLFVSYLPAPFYAVAFYIAIVTGIGYAVHSWAVDDRRLAEAAELDAAIARAELKAAAGRLQPEFLDAELARLAAVMATDPARAQRMISDLGGLLHQYLGVPRTTSEFLGGGRAEDPSEVHRGTPRYSRNSEECALTLQ